MAKLLLIIIFYFGWIRLSDGVRCYKCGSGPDDVTCDVFQSSSYWTPFSFECGDETICVKSLNYDQVVRGCTPARSVLGMRHKEGCWTHPQTNMAFCYCTLDYCNKATCALPSCLALLYGLLAPMLLRGRVAFMG